MVFTEWTKKDMLLKVNEYLILKPINYSKAKTTPVCLYHFLTKKVFD